jgi:RHS repeat-associated protein
LHGPATDQVLVQEEIISFSTLTYWMAPDHLGTIRDMTDGAGTAIVHVTFGAFGQLAHVDNPQSVPYLFGFTGREWDAETGLWYYRARYYDANTGRFLSEDPLGFAAGDTNLSRYVGNGPTNYTDPTGLIFPWIGEDVSPKPLDIIRDERGRRWQVSWIDGKPVYLLLDPDPAPPAPQPHTIHDNRGNAYHLLPPLPGGLQPFTVTNAKPNPEPHAGSSGEHCPPKHRNPLRATTPGGGDTDPNALRRPFARNTYDTLETIGWAGYAASFGAIQAQIWSWRFLADPWATSLELRDSVGASIYGAYQFATDPSAYARSQTNQTLGMLIGGGLVTVATIWSLAPSAWCETSNNVAAAGFKLGKHGDFPSPRPIGSQSHHGAMSAWMSKYYPNYDPDKAPAILMPTPNHERTFGVYNTWRAEMKNKLGGTFDWSGINETDMRRLSERMFEAAGVPLQMRLDYWVWFERMKIALSK